MHRRRPGRHARAACLPVTTALLGVALTAGCSGSGGAAPPRSSPHSTTSPGSTPTSTAAPPSQAPVGLPVGSPTPIKRSVTRPAGAKIVDYRTCTDPAGYLVDLYLKNEVFSQSDRTLQDQQLADIGGLLGPQLRKTQHARATWLADGYPASFPVVRDLDGLISVYDKLHKAARTKDLDAVPHLYTELMTVDAQYRTDANNRVCQH